jgi:hypothetical protein
MAYTLNGPVNLPVVVEKRDLPELRQACHDRQQVSRLHTGLSRFEPIAQLQHHACQVSHSITIPERTSKKYRLPLLLESSDIDADREHANINEMIIQLDTFWERFQSQNAGNGLTEVTCIVGRLESDKIRREHSA